MSSDAADGFLRAMDGHLFKPISAARRAELVRISNTPKRDIVAALLAKNALKYGTATVPSVLTNSTASKPPANSAISNASSNTFGQSTSKSSHLAASAAIHPPPKKARKPYVRSEKHDAHNRHQKEEAAKRLKAWQDGRKKRTKYCYVCKQDKSIYEFTRKCHRCIACKNSPEYPAAYKRLCHDRWWKEPQPDEHSFRHSSVFANVPETDK